MEIRREKPSVAFLGPMSTFSHQATMDLFPPQDFNLRPSKTIRDVFEEVQSEAVNYGVVPFENSTNGSVVFTLDLFADRDGVFRDIFVCGETYLDVHHCLLGYSTRSSPTPANTINSTAHVNGHLSSPPLNHRHLDGHSKPALVPAAPAAPQTRPPASSALASTTGVSVSVSVSGVGVSGGGGGGGFAHIERLYSHPQAFGQCEVFLTGRLRGVERVDVSSTSRAAQLAAEDATGASAAIASKAAAGGVGDRGGRRGGLEVLVEGIEDRADNTTRFLVLRRLVGDESEGSAVRTRGGGGGGGGGGEGKSGRHEWMRVNGHEASLEGKTARNGMAMAHKTLVSFTVDHKAPGALADAMECFRRYGLNLTSINSRPSLAHPFQYIFFVEFEGSRALDPEGKVKGALEGLERVSKSWRWLGSFNDKLKS